MTLISGLDLKILKMYEPVYQKYFLGQCVQTFEHYRETDRQTDRCDRKHYDAFADDNKECGFHEKEISRNERLKFSVYRAQDLCMYVGQNLTTKQTDN